MDLKQGQPRERAKERKGEGGVTKGFLHILARS
jgi:hypothetical protein